MPESYYTRLLNEAARLRGLGFGICRILAKEKTPTYQGWTRASLEPADFKQAYNANLGILGGALSGNLVIIDLDRPEIRAEAAKRLPRTMTDGRPSTGPAHFYYRVTDVPAWATAGANVAGGVGGPRIMHFADVLGQPIGLDFLGTGAMAVCPPSRHHSGERRCWIVEPEHLATLPYLDLWAIVKQLAKDFGAINADRESARPAVDVTGVPREPRGVDPRTLQRAIAYLAKCPPAVSGQGGHNQTFKVARAVVWGFDLGAEAGFDILQMCYNPRCDPPWSDAELMHKCEDADCLPFDKPRGGLRGREGMSGVDSTSAAGSGGGGLATTCLSNIHPEPVRWLVDGLIPLGKVSLLAGDGGQGKSTLTLELAASVTQGRPAFGLEYTPPPAGDVLLISCEDDFADTIVPRLLALGADLNKVHRVDGVAAPDGKPTPFSLAHYENLERELEKCPDVRLVVIDPAGAYIGKAGCDDHRDSDLRALLGPLADLAARRRVTILLVKHLNKGVNARAVNKVGGSTGYVNSVRSAFLVAPHPVDRERKLFLPLKFNCGAPPRGFAYRLTVLPEGEATAVLDIFAHLEAADRERLQAQLFKPEWLGPVDDDPDTVLGESGKKECGPSKPEQAAAWLTEFLGGYRWPSEEVIKAGAKAGYSRDMLFKAKDRAGVAAAKAKGRRDGGWFWGKGDSETVRTLPLRPDPCSPPDSSDPSNPSYACDPSDDSYPSDGSDPSDSSDASDGSFLGRMEEYEGLEAYEPSEELDWDEPPGRIEDWEGYEASEGYEGSEGSMAAWDAP